mgnify:CR=1 FL=1
MSRTQAKVGERNSVQGETVFTGAPARSTGESWKVRKLVQRLVAWIRYLRDPHRIAFLSAVGGGFVLGEFYHASRFGDPLVQDFVNWAKDWQTLIGGVIAVLAAAIAARPVYSQLNQMRRQSNAMAIEPIRNRAIELANEHEKIDAFLRIGFDVHSFFEKLVTDAIPNQRSRIYDQSIGLFLEQAPEFTRYLEYFDQRDPETNLCPKGRYAIRVYTLRSTSEIREFWRQYKSSNGKTYYFDVPDDGHEKAMMNSALDVMDLLDKLLDDLVEYAELTLAYSQHLWATARRAEAGVAE